LKADLEGLARPHLCRDGIWMDVRLCFAAVKPGDTKRDCEAA